MATGFQKAERKQAKLRLGITGPSGSGKTFTALEIATGMGGKIGLVDTEKKSASLYGDRFDFAVMELDEPYTADKFIKAIEAAGEAGIDVLVLDSITHEWSGEGGILDTKNKIDAAGRGNSYTNWAKVSPDHDRFIAAMLNSKMHLIATMRSKTEYLQDEENGKKIIRKLGMAPIQREGMEYEFTTVLDLALNHTATVSKDRTGMFDGVPFKPSRKTGQQLIQWLNSGKALPSPTQTPPRETGATEQGAAALSTKPMPPADPEEGEKGITREDWGSVTDAMYNAENLNELAATYKAAVRKHENEGTEAQLKALEAYKNQLKAHFGG